ncbi:DUF3168 domain-containing protein [Brevirhabdus sp.]|uniref:DUF3168 domain-containing protein n=1 Tax=Brevirhabdus sp. TaxID=2004514 RepID=UPI0040598C8A
MSYGQAAALQAAVFAVIAGDAELDALVGGAVFDMAPEGAVPGPYVLLGRETVRDRSDLTGSGALHDFTVEVVSPQGGFHAAKQVAGRIADLLAGEPPALGRGRVVSLRFLKASARRLGRPLQRRIELRFRARLSDD